MPRVDQLSPEAVKLLQEKQIAILSTTMPDGSPHATPTWVDVEPDGSHILINTVASAGYVKLRNINHDPRVAVTVVDSQNSFRTLMVRGIVVEQLGPDQGAQEHMHVLAKKYMDRDQYTFSEGETRVILRIKPTHILAMGRPGGHQDSVRWREKQEW